MTNPSEHDKLEVFWSTQDDQHYWRRVSANGQVIASGGEGFTREPDAWRAARRANPDLGEVE